MTEALEKTSLCFSKGCLCRRPKSVSKKLKFSFLRRNRTSVPPKLNLPSCTRHDIATHPWREPLYGASVLTKRTWHAVQESLHRGVLRRWPKTAPEKLKFNILGTNRTSVFSRLALLAFTRKGIATHPSALVDVLIGSYCTHPSTAMKI